MTLELGREYVKYVVFLSEPTRVFFSPSIVPPGGPLFSSVVLVMNKARRK